MIRSLVQFYKASPWDRLVASVLFVAIAQIVTVEYLVRVESPAFPVVENKRDAIVFIQSSWACFSVFWISCTVIGAYANFVGKQAKLSGEFRKQEITSFNTKDVLLVFVLISEVLIAATKLPFNLQSTIGYGIVSVCFFWGMAFNSKRMQVLFWITYFILAAAVVFAEIDTICSVLFLKCTILTLMFSFHSRWIAPLLFLFSVILFQREILRLAMFN